MAEGKDEKPTPRHRQKAREKGQVARSRELSNALACVGALGLFAWQTPNAIGYWGASWRSLLDLSSRQQIDPGGPVFFWTGWGLIRWIAPALLAAWALAVGGGLAQGGLVIATESLTFKPERMSPAAKLRQMVSLSSLSVLLKSLLPFTAIGYFGYAVMADHWGEMVQASSLGVGGFATLVTGLLFEFGWKSGLVLLAWAGVDYFLNWRKLEGDLKMSREEMRDEAKESEGNPATKGRIRRLQRQMRRSQVLRETEKATAVITNPTHFAVAIRYEIDMEAPVVVAKGRDLLAAKIKDIARWQGIPIVENPPLAQMLYRSVEPGQAIPAKLYAAVAEILAFVYKTQAQMRKGEVRK
jgi:flagellar biosynthetic protein FlhB